MWSDIATSRILRGWVQGGSLPAQADCRFEADTIKTDTKSELLTTTTKYLYIRQMDVEALWTRFRRESLWAVL